MELPATQIPIAGTFLSIVDLHHRICVDKKSSSDARRKRVFPQCPGPRDGQTDVDRWTDRQTDRQTDFNFRF